MKKILQERRYVIHFCLKLKEILFQTFQLLCGAYGQGSLYSML